jgi:hypothetical protein
MSERRAKMTMSKEMKREPVGDGATAAGVKPAMFVKAALIASIIALATALYAPHSAGQFLDLRAFYCAGQAQLSGADPYREHPLRECERTVSAPGLPPVDYGATLPVPFPGFVLMLFAALARLPFGWVFLIWQSAACAALGLAVVLAARTTRTSLTANAIVLGFPAVILALQLGQVTPFVLLAVAGCATLLQSGRPRLAALAALGALLDPHVGLALELGLFVCVPQARGVLIAGTAVLVVLGSAVSGPAREWEYLHLVLPAHALANLTEARQFSTSNFAFEAGMPAQLALTFGSVWYVGMLVAGVIVALRLRARLGSAAIAYIPAAFAVFGGTHVHLQQLAVAIPAFMLLSCAAAGKRHDVYTVVTFVAAVPWLYIAPVPGLFAVAAALAILFAREMSSGRQGLRLAAGSLFALTVMLQSIMRSQTVRPAIHAAVVGNPLAEASLQILTVARYVPLDWWYFVARAPTVVAFVLLVAAFVRAALGRSALRVPC